MAIRQVTGVVKESVDVHDGNGEQRAAQAVEGRRVDQEQAGKLHQRGRDPESDAVSDEVEAGRTAPQNG